MLKTIVWISLGAALGLPISAVAQTGYGVKPGAPSTSSFDRSWNRANESKVGQELGRPIFVIMATRARTITTPTFVTFSEGARFRALTARPVVLNLFSCRSKLSRRP